MTVRPAEDVLRGVAALIKLLGAVAAGAVPLLLPDRLVPEQLEATRAAASLVAAMGFLIAWAWLDWVVTRRRAIILAATGAAFLVIALNQFFVVTVMTGDEPAPTYVHVGFSYTEEGEAMLRAANEWTEPRAEQLASVGIPQARTLWGGSLLFMEVLYTLAVGFLLLAGTAALVAAGGGGGPPDAPADAKPPVERGTVPA